MKKCINITNFLALFSNLNIREMETSFVLSLDLLQELLLKTLSHLGPCVHLTEEEDGVQDCPYGPLLCGHHPPEPPHLCLGGGKC